MPQRSSYVEGTPNWVDVHMPDLDAAKVFYTSLFDWSYRDQPMAHGGSYAIALHDGAPVAAIAQQTPEMIASGVPTVWNTYIATDDVDAATARVADAGGTVAMAPFEVPDAGRMAVVADPSGATVALWEARGHIGAHRVNEPNTLTWNELVSGDLEAALPFYETVLGVNAKTAPAGEGEYTTLFVDDEEVAGATPPTADGVPSHWHVWFAVADADAAVAAVAGGGGRVIVAPMDVPIGRIATLADPQGAVFSVIAHGQRAAE